MWGFTVTRCCEVEVLAVVLGLDKSLFLTVPLCYLRNEELGAVDHQGLAGILEDRQLV